MMAVTAYLYGRFTESCVEGRINVIRDELWCMLVTPTYVFSQDNHKFKTIVNGEVVGSGYNAGGQKVTIDTPVYDSATNRLKVPAGNVMWPIVTWAGVSGAVLYMNPDDVTDSAKPLVAYIDFGEVIARTDQAFYLNIPSTGVMRLGV